MKDGVAIPREQLPPGDWLYAQDGLSASLEGADADIQLHIDQSAIEKEFWKSIELPNTWMEFSCPFFKAVIPVKRRMAGRPSAGDRFYQLSPVWVVSYASIIITLKSGQVIEAPKLDRESWFAFDLVFYSALAHWPQLEQESQLANPPRERLRLLVLLGGYASFGWFAQLTKITGATHNLVTGNEDPELAINNPELLDGLRSVWKVDDTSNVAIENCHTGDVLEDSAPINYGPLSYRISGGGEYGSENNRVKLLKFRYAEGGERMIPLGISDPPVQLRTTYFKAIMVAALENGVQPENLMQTYLDAKEAGLMEPSKLPELFKLSGDAHQNWKWLLRVSEAIWVASQLCPEHFVGPLGRISVGWLEGITGVSAYYFTLFPGQYKKTLFGIV